MSRPTWHLDFDGVINAVTRKPDRNVHSDWKYVNVPIENGTYPIWYSPTVVDCIQDALRVGIRVVWLSSWKSYTSVLPNYVDNLPEMDYLIDGPDSVDWWKLDALKRDDQLHDSNRILWIDDDIGMDEERWSKSYPKPVYVLKPNPFIGLTRKNLKTIREFISLHTARA